MSIETERGVYKALLRVKLAIKASASKKEPCNLWHQQLGHCSDDVMSRSIPMVHGISGTDFTASSFCETRAFLKVKRASRRAISSKNTETVRLVEHVFLDVSLCSRK